MAPINAESFILAGGDSSRFGRSKALHPIEGVPMILRIYRLLKAAFPEVTVVSKSPESYAKLNLPTLIDSFSFQAPLAGVLSALSIATSEWLFIVACDYPNLTLDFIHHLWNVRAGLGVIPVSQNRTHPLAAFYHQQCRPLFQSAYENGDYTLTQVIDSDRFRQVSGFDSHTLWNVNHPDDLIHL
ncbi:MAG: molybdenum cofactor guanylyltransferase [Fidelibacterota bacterium]|nr:MAG: molybdenum cofactor guanylyltransferase [Candidatus Neomarinimicrobiota bacterium]